MADVDVHPAAGGDIVEDSRPGRRILCDRRDLAALAPLFADPDAWFDHPMSGERYKHDRTTTVVRARLAGRDYHLKRYNTKNVWHALRRPFRRSRALNCWTMARRFLAAGIPTARPVAVIQEHWGPLALRSYFISESLPGLSLDETLRQKPETAPRLAARMADIFRALWDHRLVHGDLKAANILVDAGGEPHLLDLDAARHLRLRVTRHRAWLRDRTRFLRNFEGDPALNDIFRQAIPEEMGLAGQ